MLAGIPQSPFHEAPRRTRIELEAMARRLRHAFDRMDRRQLSSSWDHAWHALLEAAAPIDLAPAQHWDDIAASDATYIIDRLRAWKREGRQTAWAAAKLVTADWCPRADGRVDVLVERQGVPYLTETVATPEDALRRLDELREKMQADGWSLL